MKQKARIFRLTHLSLSCLVRMLVRNLWMIVATALIFFLPPFWLLFQARKEKDRKTVLVLRLISAGTLILSLIFLVLNFLSVYFSAQTGLVLYVLLVMFSAPMTCGQYWAMSLFLWACLLILSFQKRPD